jgi:two-component system, chemotaxis family, chemotaxis protein CheY
MGPDVLVVDGSAAIRKILQRVLHGTEIGIHTILEANDGEEALEILRQAKIGLILTEINLAKIDGIQLLTALKAAPAWRDIPVVMITAESCETKVVEAVRLGAAGYVRKPFSAVQLKDKLVRILGPE